ncbi:putative Pentatricopeptide repeat-containing protein [Quillaja saponaria]|uniref:Pentatricopeptide repeat-containing protein n=1 Tax=Quillaja saponaria TaxID=32244 RepID=A0AAD7PPP4_QUISA|nr:putative Pentatricopeptide repeat-containing protein [Quillaja saponaria]
MDKLTLTHHLNPYSLQNPLTQKPPRSHSHVSFSLGVTDAPIETSVLASSPSLLKLSSRFHFLDYLGQIKTLSSVKVLHAQMFKMPNKGSLDAMDKSLITYYLQSGDFMSAAMVFFVGFARSYLVWNSFLDEFESFGGNPHDILVVFEDLYHVGIEFDSIILTAVLKLCTNLLNLWLGLEIHACLIKKGFDLDLHLACALINFYERCWGIDKANQVFHEMPYREDFLWNTIIMVNLKKERWLNALQLFHDMQFSFAKAIDGTIVKLLQACGKVGALNEGKQIHGYVLRCRFESNLSICNSLISMYSRNDRIELARTVFDSMEEHSLSSWNSIISSYAALGYLNDAQDLFSKMKSSNFKPDIITWNCLLSGHSLHGSYETVLAIFKRLQGEGFKPDSCSVISVLRAIIELGFLNYGKEIHGYVIRNELDYDAYVETSLVDMYVKNNCLKKAHKVFNNMKNKNLVAWNSLISGYSFKGLFQVAETLLKEMEKEGIKSDLATWNSLLSGYSIGGRTKEALSLIQRIKHSGLTPNVISWTSLISGCAQNANYRDAFEFFIQMQVDNIKPNSATICSLLQACAGLALLKKGEEIHCLSVRLGFVDDIYVATALIDMYSKAGNLKTARTVFRRIRIKTLASWNCMIMGCAIYGSGEEAIILFNEMFRTGIRPDAITFTAILSGCKNSGLTEEGWKYFDSMKKEYNMIPTIEHYCCMVDLLGRAGYLDEAWDFIQMMPLKPDASIWGALLASCRNHKNIELGETAAKWEEVERLKDLTIVMGVKSQKHVWSWTQINQTIHIFSAEGQPHPDAGEIYFELYKLVSEIRKLGYQPDINCVYQNIVDNEKEKILLSHTEKLAITYGLVKTKSQAPIRVMKNTRICHDCHTMAKYISLARSREIFLRDGARFHHFREGECSCNDQW